MGIQPGAPPLHGRAWHADDTHAWLLVWIHSYTERASAGFMQQYDRGAEALVANSILSSHTQTNISAHHHRYAPRTGPIERAACLAVASNAGRATATSPARSALPAMREWLAEEDNRKCRLAFAFRQFRSPYDIWYRLSTLIAID